MAYKFNPFTGTLDDVGSGGAAGNFVTLDTVQTITAEKTIRNSTVDATPLTVNALAAHSGNLQSWQVNGTPVLCVNQDGTIYTLSSFMTWVGQNTSLVVGAAAGPRDVTLPAMNGDAVIPVVGFGTDPAGAGEVAVVNRTGVTAVSAPVVDALLTNGTAAGFYQIAIEGTIQTTVASRAVTIYATWQGTKLHTGWPLAAPLIMDGTRGDTIAGYLVLYLASGDIKWGVNVSGGADLVAGRLAVRMRCIYLGP